MAWPIFVGLASRPVKRAKRPVASATSAQTTTRSIRPSAPLGCVEPALLPHRVLGAVGQHLDAALRHRAALEPHHREGGDARPGLGLDRALELHQRPHGKARLGQAPVLAFGIDDRERRQMHAGVAGQRRLELAAERRVGGLEQHLDIAAAEHRGDVAGAGRRAVGIVLHRHRRRRKARARQRPARGLGVADEMADVIEKDLARQPAVGGPFLCSMRDWRSPPAPSCRGCFPGRSVSIWKTAHAVQPRKHDESTRCSQIRIGLACGRDLAHSGVRRYPDRPIKLIVPFSPGGATDVVGRLWAERMKAKFGTVVVENKGGGGGVIGATEVARSTPERRDPAVRQHQHAGASSRRSPTSRPTIR